MIVIVIAGAAGAAGASLTLLGCAYILFRNNKVGNIRSQALKLTSKYAKKAVNIKNIIYFYSIYDSYPSYDKMLWKLFTFSFEKLYPDLEKRLQNVI